ncbi:rhomboid family intramembrane serine protease [Pelagicoccus sp. SDUM812003]|uniref:rhomboid family intramembrane serine protease n=1 Tax=Pelagicoccus sp. SDUM812003 TaxID=3041267 RepID=UPI00280E6B21|nr:rhomboid family intramembrane serine protease [Pelagicoccus sp. SDUM812003]MDQ8203132.1 rhomboid family intramembrane serine protease [Pelagicoccus sp. SDUM812003]
MNALLFVATYIVGDNQERLLSLLALHFPQSDDFRAWQLVTHMFMHGSPTHILFNMFGLYTFGGVLERIWGARRFLVFYFVAGVGAGIIFTAVNLYQFSSIYDTLLSNGVSTGSIQNFLDTAISNRDIAKTLDQDKALHFLQIYHGSVVGASGAIYGVLVAFAILFPNAKLALIFLPVPIAAKFFVPAMLLLDLFSEFTGFSLFGGGIAHMAHIGGALIGFLLMLYWRDAAKRRSREDPEIDSEFS